MIAVHAGAGYHSPALEAAYKRDLGAACRAGAAALAGGGDALAAVTAAIKVLEDSAHCNAGHGSNLSFNGAVECDASVMAGDGTFGSVAAVPGIQNPVEAAALLARESRQRLSNGRVRPMMLAGDRAREWALSRGLAAAATSAQAASLHVTERAQRQWRKYRGIVDNRSRPGGSGGGGGDGGGGTGLAAAVQQQGQQQGEQQAHAVAQAGGEQKDMQKQRQLPQQTEAGRPAKRRKPSSRERGRDVSKLPPPLPPLPPQQRQQQQQQQDVQQPQQAGQAADAAAAEAGSAEAGLTEAAAAAGAEAGASTEAAGAAEAAAAAAEAVGEAACCFYDTVGCVVLAPDGSVAAGVSSGGIVLKTEGRVGEAAIHGAGCWAQQQESPQEQPELQQQLTPLGPGADSSSSSPGTRSGIAAAAAAAAAASERQQQRWHQQQHPVLASVACSVTGVGEHVMRHLLARECCQAAAAATSAVPGAASAAVPPTPPLPAAAQAAVMPTAATSPPPAAAAAAAGGDEEAWAASSTEEVPLAEVAARLLERTILRGPPPFDCGLLCLKAQLLDSFPTASAGEEQQPQQQQQQRRPGQPALDGSGSGRQQQARGVHGLPSQQQGREGQQDQEPGQQQQAQGQQQEAPPLQQQQQQRYAVELAVAHSAQSMAFAHMSCMPGGTAAGAGSSGKQPAAAAQPAVYVLRRPAAAGGGGSQAAPAVQTYMHGLTLHL